MYLFSSGLTLSYLFHSNGSVVPPHLRSKIPSIADVIEEKDGSLIIVMDFIEGDSVKKVLEKKGVISEERVIRWSKQLCEILAFLHSKEIIYRDVKPENIMYQKETDEVAIIDFGTASTYQRLTDGTTALGSRGYSAPEQCNTQQTDARTDIYCLGRTMYSLLTGIDLGLKENQAIDTSDLKEKNPAVSSALCRIITKCTQISQENRYQSCEELLYAFETITKDRKKDIAKMCVFISFLSLSVVSGIFGYLLNLQAKALATDNYKDLIDSASAIIINTLDENYAERYDEKIHLYQQAIAVAEKSGEKDAYLGILETYKENDRDAPVFTKDEAEEISNLIKMHKAVLEVNMESYVDICYEIGKLYWYYYDTDNQMTKSIYAVNWFQIVTENADVKNYNQKKLGLAKVYAEIGTFYKKVIDLTTMETIEDSEYIRLFENIRNMVDEIASDSSESDIVRLELLGMARFALRQYAIDFKRAFENSSIENGKEKMMKLYDQIALQLSTINVENYAKESTVYIKKAEIQKYMSATEKAIQDAYHASGKETETS